MPHRIPGQENLDKNFASHYDLRRTEFLLGTGSLSGGMAAVAERLMEFQRPAHRGGYEKKIYNLIPQLFNKYSLPGELNIHGFKSSR